MVGIDERRTQPKLSRLISKTPIKDDLTWNQFIMPDGP